MSQLQLRIYDGSRQLFSPPANFLVTFTDGNQQQQVRDFFQGNVIDFDLPFFDNFGDNYTVLVFADGFRQAGFVPVKLSDQSPKTIDIMLVADNPGFNFAAASFTAANALYPFLSADTDHATALARYNDLLDNSGKVLACILNLGEAMGQIPLDQGTPLTSFKELLWTAPFAPAQDRFFAWCDRRLIDQVKAATARGEFAVDPNPGLLHPGATSSWKQIQFGEANVQLTFHENNTTVIDGVDCVIVEPDMDYFKDPLAHILLEVVPNAITHSLTNPVEVYILRWIAGRAAAAAEFAPIYTLTS